MKSISQITNVKILLIVVLDGFDSRKFALVDSIHEFPRATSFIGDFLNFGIEKIAFCRFDFTLKCLLVFQTS